MVQMNRAIFLDRDGTIIEEKIIYRMSIKFRF